MTDRGDISSSDNSNDAEASEVNKTPAAEPQLSLQEIIACNREKAIQLRAAKRSLAQDVVQLVRCLFLQSWLILYILAYKASCI